MRAMIISPIKDKSDFWIMGDDELIYHIKEGTGDNLSQEDIDDGYVDYIYIDVFRNNLSDIEDGDIFDGGMILLKDYYRDLTLEAILGIVEEQHNVKFFGIEEVDWNKVCEDIDNKGGAKA